MAEAAAGDGYSEATHRTYVIYTLLFGSASSAGPAQTCALGVGEFFNDTAQASWMAGGVTTTGGSYKFRSPAARGWLHLPADGGGSAARCLDEALQMPLPLPLVAPPGWKVVSPLSTAAASLVVHRGRTVDAVGSEIASSLSLPYATPALEAGSMPACIFPASNLPVKDVHLTK